MLSESRKKANQKWDAANMKAVACKIKIDQAERFKVECALNGKTCNTVLRDFVLEYIGERTPEGQEDRRWTASEITFPPEAITKAQEAAQKNGETVEAFLFRAITSQAERDAITRRLNGIK